MKSKARATQKAPARKRAAPLVPKDKLPEPGPALPDHATEMRHDSDSTPAVIGPLPGDRYPTPQPEDAHHTKSRRAKKRKPRQGDQDAAELQQPPSPSGDMDLATEPNDAKVISSKVSGGGSNPPEIIDLTVKEESRSATPVSPARAPEPNEDPAGLKAGWVRPS